MNDTTLAIAAQAPVLLRPIAHPAEIISAHQETVQLIQKVLKEGVDYGTIPGTGKWNPQTKREEANPTLLKPGAERLLIAFGCAAHFEIAEKEVNRAHENTYSGWETVDDAPDRGTQEDMKKAKTGRSKKQGDSWIWQEKTDGAKSFGLFRYVIRCKVVHRSTGQVVGEGLGSCSSEESKYVYRPSDSENTVLKMAEKRSLIAATLHAFALSDRFTQDLEDTHDDQPTPPGPSVAEQELKDASTYIKSIKVAKDGFELFKVYCVQAERPWPTVALSAQKEGVSDKDGLFAFAVGLRKVAPVIEGELVAEETPEDDPKGQMDI